MNETSPILEPGQFYGSTDRGWKTGLVTLTLLRHAVPRIVPMHSHAHMYIALLLEGGYREWPGTDDQGELVYQPLTAVFHPAGHQHRDEITAPDSVFFAIEIDPSIASGRDHDQLRTVHDLSGGPAIWSMLRLLDAVHGHQRDTLEGEEPVVEILEQLLAREDVGPAPHWLARVETHLREQFAAPASLRTLAELAGVHPVYLARVFRRHHGCSIREFLHAQRTLRASREIAAGVPLVEVALAAGFYDQSHMTHVFKAVTGMTPDRYRGLRCR
jgi:AraC family transcriptional regulator